MSNDSDLTENTSLADALVALRAALPRHGRGAPVDADGLRRALREAARLLASPEELAARRRLLASAPPGVAPSRLVMRLGDPAADAERLAEVVRAHRVADELGGMHWAEFTLRASLLLEHHLARLRFIEEVAGQEASSTPAPAADRSHADAAAPQAHGDAGTHGGTVVPIHPEEARLRRRRSA